MKIIEAVKKNATRARWVGILLIVTGFLALLSPLAAGFSVTVMIGALLLVTGVSEIVLAFGAGSLGEGLGLVVLGVVGVIAGLAVLGQPGIALASLTLLLAIYFAVSGLTEIISALGAAGAPGRGWLIFDGVVSLVLGIMIWRQFPVSGTWAVGVLVGIRFILTGSTLLAIGSAVGSVVGKPEKVADG